MPKIRFFLARSWRSCSTPRYRSSGVIAWSIHDEKGCVPAARMRSPSRAARSWTAPRRRTTSERISAGVSHTVLPTSTTD